MRYLFDIPCNDLSAVTRKPVFGVSDQVRLQTSLFSYKDKLELLDLASIDIILSK